MIIDVSEHQGKIDWEKVKSSGVEGAIIRCGYGSNIKSQDDKCFLRNVEECIRLGIPFGIYLYSYAKNSKAAKSEISHVKRLIEGLPISLGVFYDLEEPGTEKAAKENAKVWLEEMSSYNAGIYASLSWFKNYLKDISCKKWVASWGSKKPAFSDMVLWQYSDRGSVSGIAGHVDLNEMISYTNVQSEEPKSESSESESNEKVSDTKMQTIRQGSTGKAVKIWQIIIGVEADGKFGPKTLNATRTFQANNGLDVDGIVGPKTWKKGLESVG